MAIWQETPLGHSFLLQFPSIFPTFHSPEQAASGTLGEILVHQSGNISLRVGDMMFDVRSILPFYVHILYLIVWCTLYPFFLYPSIVWCTLHPSFLCPCFIFDHLVLIREMRQFGQPFSSI
jgi:hypothetical protein